ncbi:MAG: hypothetical protein KGK00_18530, partial [Paracoccaceae bacterium]|nr:hypothetical protein [Paracoccaceae bacterium]
MPQPGTAALLWLSAMDKSLLRWKEWRVSIGEGAHTSGKKINPPAQDAPGQGPDFGPTDSLMGARRWDLLSVIPLVAIVA